MKERKFMGQEVLETIKQGIIAGATLGYIIGGWWVLWLILTR